jgi:3-phenylpropionate/trans-cinnamate dioxygenase ferredoxin reductase component
VVDIHWRGKQAALKTTGREIIADAVVAGMLRTRHPDIYAAGDVATFYNPALGKRLRVEHEDNANTMGRLAARSMAGRSEPYHHLPFFYSDLFELGYEQSARSIPGWNR